MSTSQLSEKAMPPRVLLVHGEGPLPPAPDLESLWVTALGHGLRRDHDLSLDPIDLEFLYLGDLTAEFCAATASYDALVDVADARNALQSLMKFNSAKKFRRSRYESIPGQTPLPEFIADLSAPLSRAFGLGQRRIARQMPELDGYWKSDRLREQLQTRLRNAFHAALSSGAPVLLISHGLGCVYAWDALRELAATDVSGARLHTWITLGTPLGDDSIRSRLLSSDRPYPEILLNWHNVAAEDDPVCHDSTVADDYAPMLRQHLLSRIRDHHIYNLSERFGRSDPHDALGYLIHPRTSLLIRDWLRETLDTRAADSDGLPGQ